MTSRDFAYWLMGLLELSPEALQNGLTVKQTDLIKSHLDLVFKCEIDPSHSPDTKVQEELTKIHSGKIPNSPKLRCQMWCDICLDNFYKTSGECPDCGTIVCTEIACIEDHEKNCKAYSEWHKPQGING